MSIATLGERFSNILFVNEPYDSKYVKMDPEDGDKCTICLANLEKSEEVFAHTQKGFRETGASNASNLY